METVRFRLIFDDRHILSKSQKAEGLRRCWLLLKPGQETVSDLASHLIRTFDLHDTCPYGVVLSMDGFILPPFESTHILKDKDVIRVKKKGVALTDIFKVSDENLSDDSDIAGKPSVHNGVKLLAAEEFEKETGGYQSEPEEENEYDHPKDQSNIEKISNENPMSKKRKLLKKSHNSKRKKMRSDSPKKCPVVVENVENDVQREQNESFHDNAIPSPERLHKKRKASNVKGRKDIASSPEVDGIINNIGESTPGEKRSDQPQKNGPDSVDASNVPNGTKKLPSRSARRKKAKRHWLRELAKSQENEPSQRQLPKANICESSPEHQQTVQTSDKEDEIVPVIVRPGHIRFESTGKDNVVGQNQDHAEIFQWNGTTCKKKGQKWGKEKISFSGRNNYPDSDQETSKRLITEERELVPDTLDFDKLTPLSGFPKEGDVVAYRLVELSSSWCPELSSVRVGKISMYDRGSNQIILMPVPEYPVIFDKKRDEDTSGTQQETSLYSEDGSLEIDFASLVDVRIIKHGNPDPATDVTGGFDEAPENNGNAISGAGPNGQVSEAPVTENGELNAWDEISRALSEKKMHLLVNDGWTRKETSSRSSWPYKALRSSALGPTMALLRAQKDLLRG